MDTVYKKVGRRYVECGVMDFPRFENGNWLVVVNGTLSSYMKVGDGEDLPKLATIKRLETKLAEVAQRKKDPDIMWGRMDKSKPKRLTKKQVEANKAFCEAFAVGAVWCTGESLHGSVERVVKTALEEIEKETKEEA